MTSANVHMHYYATGAMAEVLHFDGTVTKLLDFDNYTYDRPQVTHVLNSIFDKNEKE